MKKSWIVLGAVGLVVIVLIGWMASVYNALVSAHETVASQWAQVETQYQRRFDLIPNLVNTVKGSAKFEQDTLTQVTQARSAWAQAGQATGTDAASAQARASRIAAAQQLDGGLNRLLVTVESYPQLQTPQAFRDLMTEIEGTENRVSVARRDYNDAVQRYNLQVKRFPGSVLAGMYGFAPEQFFQSTPGSQNAPAVNFGG